ncbi:MLO-like protein 4 [Andrographis paniculata]|uniref:MLO-like protein 4 n=1 Tax=Andrographis paniculata TaxID=175694 RepID=UPI0021E90A53|nr:MLO-like protein 4 [Andrographis paniculata]
MGEEEVGIIREGRSLEVTPTWSVATVTTVMVFLCLFLQRSIYKLAKWLKKTKRKALWASLERIKEELMLLGLISLMLGQWARWISQICVKSSLFTTRFYICSQHDYPYPHSQTKYSRILTSISNGSRADKAIVTFSHACGEGREPFVSAEGLEQLHRFLFVLGITHVLYSCIAVALAMTKIYSWRKWEVQACAAAEASSHAKNRVMRRQTTFALHHASHPWSHSRILIWMLCFLKQFRSSVHKSDYMALRSGFIANHKLHASYDFHKYMVRSMEDEFYAIVGISWPLWGYAILCIFINIHGLNIYFWLSFIPAILVLLVGTKLQHVVSLLALEMTEQRGASNGTQVKPSDDLFWFGKPEILLRLIQFISFQNAFEMATFTWSLWGLQHRSCFMRNHAMIIIRLISGVVVQFWCSYSTVPLNVLVTTMGSRCKKALIAESVRESLHSWCKRVKARSKATNSITTRSTCSLESTIDERDETVSATLSPCSSARSSCRFDGGRDPECGIKSGDHEHEHEQNEANQEVLSETRQNEAEEEKPAETLLQLFHRT